MKNKKETNTPKFNLKKGWLTLAVLLAIVAVISLLMLARRAVSSHNAEQQYSEMTTQVNSPKVAENSKEYSLDEKIQLIEEAYGIEVPRKNIDFTDLQQNTNEDIYAWLYIPGTNVDYPVLQHPTDDSFYLMRNLDKSYGYPSCIYSESVNSKDFNDRVTVLYGHDLSGGRMFGDLKHFAEKEYFDANRYMFVYLPDDIKVYEIFSSFKNTDVHLMYGYDWSNDQTFRLFMQDALSAGENSSALESYQVDPDDKVLVLSTCVRNEPEHRRLVLGALLNETYE